MEYCGNCVKFSNEDINGDGFCSKKEKMCKCTDIACSDIENNDEATDEWLKEAFETVAFKEEQERILKIRKKTLSDYKKYRHFSEVPYDYIKEEVEGLEHVETVGFISGFDKTQKYGNDYYRLKFDDLIKVNRDKNGNNIWSWLDGAYFKLEDREYQLVIEENEDFYKTKNVEFVEYIVQRCDWEDCYRGFIGLPMTDGRIWLIYYQC